MTSSPGISRRGSLDVAKRPSKHAAGVSRARPQDGSRLSLSAALREFAATCRAALTTSSFLLNLYPMLPPSPLNLLARPPRVERLRYTASYGEVDADLYRPAGRGPYPGVVVCLGVVPIGIDHPQVARLGRALARAGFAALLYWSPAMRDCRLDPADSQDIARAYAALLARPNIDGSRSGLIGACVGGSFALLAAAQAEISERVTFICAYAPYASLWTLTRDVASGTRVRGTDREPWDVDPLTRSVYERTLTAFLGPGDGASSTISALLAPQSVAGVDATLRRLPATLHERLRAMSPLNHARRLHAPLIVLCHDRDDPVIPVSESRTLARALARGADVRYTEFTVFQHLDPTRSKPSRLALARELLRFWGAIYPLFRRVERPTVT